VIRDLTLDSNTIIEWTHAPDHPLRGGLQGIGMFDGPYENLLIQNNVVVTRHTHGISVYGAFGAQIINNTVVSLSGRPGKYPMIRVKKQKDGTPSENVRVANNLAMGFEGGNTATNVIFSKNTVITDPVKVLQTLVDAGYIPASVMANARLSAMVLRAFGPPESFFLQSPANPGTAASATGSDAAVEPSPVPLPAPLIPLLSALGALAGLAGLRKLRAAEQAAREATS
jgi:hypothetical protein